GALLPTDWRGINQPSSKKCAYAASPQTRPPCRVFHSRASPLRRGLFVSAGEASMATEQQVQQTLADLPTWLLILVALAGLTGEMWRADAAGMAVGELVKRVMLRFGASAVFGLA